MMVRTPVLGMLFAFVATPAQAGINKWSTYCSVVPLYLQSLDSAKKPKGYGYVTIAKESRHDSDEAFKVSVRSAPNIFGKAIVVKDLTVAYVKSSLIDSTKEISDGGLGRYETQSDVYGVKVHFEADEPIDIVAHGDIAGPVKKTDRFTICTDQISRPAR